ncbi:hypothetical protein GQ55_9G249300 [Panicum hallii var. hallii]|uniref:Uncharacterized protein n=1 Tax=Panicum hallii var. hallii TaxID=1504633 RepID=A0A2T7C6S2_9POAL|nr:hypothetical protein GQ55_9G249300 [Panicum hallii var. hallii]
MDPRWRFWATVARRRSWAAAARRTQGGGPRQWRWGGPRRREMARRRSWPAVARQTRGGGPRRRRWGGQGPVGDGAVDSWAEGLGDGSTVARRIGAAPSGEDWRRDGRRPSKSLGRKLTCQVGPTNGGERI